MYKNLVVNLENFVSVHAVHHAQSTGNDFQLTWLNFQFSISGIDTLKGKKETKQKLHTCISKKLNNE